MGKLENMQQIGDYSGKNAANPVAPLGFFLPVGIQASALSQLETRVGRQARAGKSGETRVLDPKIKL
jgi:hypothetical protein